MQEVELIVALLAIIGIVGAIAQRLRIALPILLVFVGMIISLIPQVPAVLLEPDIVFFIFLPPLLHYDAFDTTWKELKAVGELISLQAVGLVLASVAGVAAAIHAVIPNMPWAVAFTFGAIVSPTDAVAVSAIAKDVQLPKRLVDIIKGESLVNDATGLVAYEFAIAAALTGAFSWSEAGRRFLYVGFGGIAIGLIIGWLVSKIRTKLDHTPVEIIVSIICPFVAYLAAEHLHVSGVLSVVTSGLLQGWYAPRMESPRTRMQATATWGTITYVLNGFSFLLIGLQLRPIINAIKVYPANEVIVWTLTAALTPILIRFIWAFTVGPLYSLTRRQVRPNWKHLFIFSWCGMRGVVSLAAALAIPLTAAYGQPFPYRELLIFFTIVVIISTLVFQGLSLPYFVKKSGFILDRHDAEYAERMLRTALSREAVRKIDEFVRNNGLDMQDPAFYRVLNKYLEQAIDHANEKSHEMTKGQVWLSLEHEAISAQRQMLISLRDKHEIEEELFRIMQHELDLEETHLLVSPG